MQGHNFLFVGLRFTLRKKEKIKTEHGPKMYKIVNIRSVIYINYLYSKKIVNLSQKDQIMGTCVNFNNFK